MRVDPAKIFQGVVVVTVPHMDDCILACGGTIAQLPEKERIHFIYATDGSQSPVPTFSWQGSVALDLREIREREALMALGVLGIPPENIHFLGFPDGKLKDVVKELHQSLAALFTRIKPAHVLTPFRYDRHPDHLALNAVTMEVLQSTGFEAQLTEYFVYYRWRLLPGGDVRKYIHADHLAEIDIKTEADPKRKALECFRSQTTKFYAWQDRPILTESLVDEVCREPELFLKYNPLFPEATIFTKWHTWMRFAHYAEPLLKKRKDEVVTSLRRGLGR